MDDAGASDRRRALAVLAFAAVAFVALLIFGLGVASLLLDQAVNAEPGMSQAPGIAGTVVATLGFVLVVWPALRAKGGAGRAVLAALAAAFGYVAGFAAGALGAGSDPFRALAVAGALAVSWPPAVIAVAALVSAAGALVAVRAEPGGARWPWEREED